MRKNTMQVFEDWLNGNENRKQNSIWTDGDTIYSYGTAIATMGPTFDTVILNRSRYSNTTTQHQNALAVLLHREAYIVHELDNLTRGIQGEALYEYGAEYPITA